jgi:hypothetical protein
MLPGFVLFFVALVCAAQNRLTPQEKAAGWKLLFDGTTTAGWLEVTGLPFPTTSWTIENGCLKALQNPDGIQDIRTAGTYRSFELQFEWKIARNGNSGVKYLVQKTDRWQRKGEKGFQARARGLEYQLTDDSTSAEAKVEPSRGTASLYSYIAPATKVSAAPEVFHQSRIVVKGDHVEHWLNGVKVLSFELSQPELAEAFRKLKAPPVVNRDTTISLQNHSTDVWFRNIKVRRLE